ncbi:25S rRNA (uracil(2634)-N(3))-methyltransferase [Malassezia vespertilionis]|uniref:25S rRNA (uracil(2634)-N(3))-methyltransferase n=1 Tax=Malassezia vespertilionis TaxID=2020962 RepID=UPI0024B0F6C4|nr:25S rRNA (uracil(2634)-N(3))-methyltransferase [Malassezia vespertilionis]WFD07924.1 25S rRNA (uracil(2634)-N(3))-methyltransferase [Malassezia vespertilionis]
MARRGKGKLRTALAQHNARRQQRQDETRRAQIQESQLKKKVAVPKRRHVLPFAQDDSILLVGEGNFSFALSLLRMPHLHPPHQILATSYDTEDEVCKKYPDAPAILAEIRALAGGHADSILAFGVDAGALQKCELVTGKAHTDPRRWSKVWFGFPHVGAGHKDEHRNVLANQVLILRFLVSVAPYLTRGPLPTYASRTTRKINSESDSDDDENPADAEQETVPLASRYQLFTPPVRQGSVLITLRNAVPYTLWNVPMLAKRLRSVLAPTLAAAPPLPKGMHAPTIDDVDRRAAQYAQWRSFEFHPGDWAGYSHRRTVGYIEGRSTSHNEDLLRQTAPDEKQEREMRRGRHVGTGECRTFEFGLHT